VGVPRRSPDRASELAEIEARYHARCDEIKAERVEYGERLREWLQRRREKADEAHVPLGLYLDAHRAMHRRRPMTEDEADRQQAALLRVAHEDYVRELHALELKTRFLTGGGRGLNRAEVRSLARQIVTEIDARKARGEEADKPGPRPTEVSPSKRRRVAELRIEGATAADIMRDTGLSKTVATRLVRGVDEALGRTRSGRY
jgi:hypothetical protein